MYVELKDIQKNYKNYTASDHVSFSIEKGKLVALLGPSGSGKSTILRMIAGLETPDVGDIFIDGKSMTHVSPKDRGIGFVFQSYALFRYMNVFDNIAFGLQLQKISKAKIKEEVMDLIELIGLKGLEKRYPAQLSGGQRQRVAFARALAPKPRVLLLDEPFAAIDAKVRLELRSWLKETIHKVGITSIFVTHDQDEALEVADEIIVTNQGRVEQMGSPMDIYKNPRSPFVAEFIGDSKILANGHTLSGFEQLVESQKAVIRPEFVSIAKRGKILQFKLAAEAGIVEHILFRGHCMELQIRIINKEIQIHTNVSLDEVYEVGETVDVLIHRLYVFEGNMTKLIENEAMNDSNLIVI